MVFRSVEKKRGFGNGMRSGVGEVSQNTVFRLSPDEAQSEFFQGYAFVDNDLIVGADGLASFHKNTLRKLTSGEDGCYVHIKREGKRFKVVTDHSGFKSIFYFWSPEYWVVSNSIPMVLEALKNKGIEIEPRYSQLASIAASGTFFQQPYSYRTIAAGVKILPLGYELLIGDCGATEVRCAKKPQPTCYEESMLQFLEVWVSRFETLLANENSKLTADLTGGLDSRCVFSLIHAAQRRLGRKGVHFFCGGAGVDFKIAGRICDYFSEKINKRMPKNEHQLTGTESYEGWRLRCLGAYHPIYFPFVSPGLHAIRIGGNGGGNHRPFYEKNVNRPDLTKFLKNRRRQIHPEWLLSEFDADIQDWIDSIDNLIEADVVDSLILHYRQFRNRFHSGRVPQSMFGFHPLSSRYLDDVSRLAGSDRVRSGQIFFDLMHSLEPSLLKFEFDDPAKGPSEKNESALVKVVIDPEPRPGRVFGRSVEANNVTSVDQPMNILRNRIMSAKRNHFVKHFFGSERVDGLVALLEEAASVGRLSHAREGALAAAIIAAAEMVPD